MPTINGVDTEEFGRRVERLCDFLLTKVSKDGSDDVKVILDIQEDAANLQFSGVDEMDFSGLSSYMKGAPK
jgi:hypothetical protein